MKGKQKRYATKLSLEVENRKKLIQHIQNMLKKLDQLESEYDSLSPELQEKINEKWMEKQ